MQTTNELVRIRTELAPRQRTTLRKAAFYATAGVLPAVVGLAVGVRSKRLGILAGTLTGLALGFVRWQLQRWFAAQPAYEVEHRTGLLELRRYAPHVEAQTHMHHLPLEDALEHGFRRLSTYRIGANAKKDAEPVNTFAVMQGERLEMTLPVITQSHDDGHLTMALVMPPGRSLASLPLPLDNGVELRQIPERRVAALGFHGPVSETNVAQAEADLIHGVLALGLTPCGEPAYASFDPPSTLPAFRRSEVWIEVQ